MSEPSFSHGAVDLSALSNQQRNQQHNPQRPGGNEQSADELNITAENIQQLIEASKDQATVVLIGTQRSEASEALRADFRALTKAMPGAFRFAYIDADAAADAAQMFGVRALPTVVALYQGQPLANFEGAQPKDALTKWIQAIQEAIGQQPQQPQAEEEPQGDPRFDEATDALNAGDFDAAIAVYEKILLNEPKNSEAKQARDNARLLKRLQERDQQGDPIAQANEAPQDVALAFAAADVEVASGKAEAAFARLIALLKLSHGEQKNEIRERLVELFALFDATDPRVLSARADMANALF